jgi:2-hydroxy-4-(methylsulfanyl)butanoate S-methyltransferase
VQNVTTREELSAIAYGFMGSKALFAALEADVFTCLADGPLDLGTLAARTGTAPNRLRTLLHALAGLGLVAAGPAGWANSPGAQRYLVRGVEEGFGEYFRLQVGRQIYPALVHLDEGMAGKGTAFDGLTGLLADRAEAATFTDAQHAGSLGAARALARRLDLAGARRLLDVGGGSGAFSIAFCERYAGLRATVLDVPAVVEVARRYRDAAGPASRIDLLAGDVLTAPWPGGQDVVLCSYLLSALAGPGIDVVLARAYEALAPGGLLVVHDFMLDDTGPGPLPAALWFLQYLAYQPDADSFSAADLAARAAAQGFGPADVQVLIPGITKVLITRQEMRS